MKVLSIGSQQIVPGAIGAKKAQEGFAQHSSLSNQFEFYDKSTENINRAMVSFKGYGGDREPINKLFWILTGRSYIHEDNWTYEHLYRGGDTGYKKWVNAPPEELLKRTTEQAIQSVFTTAKHPVSTNYGDQWGRHANYIEINPRSVAKYEGHSISEGLYGVMKLLPAIPPSPNGFANCVILSQLFPSLGGDGSLGDSGLYGANVNGGISKNLTSPGLEGRMGDDELVKAFNDLAHQKGLKTGFRMPLSSGQLSANGGFNWYDNQEDFIRACCWGVDLGFDAIYFDSGKHVSDKNHYCGNGEMPDYGKMQYITSEIRKRTGRNDLSFIGEKCDNRYEYKDIGFNAGTDWGKADDFESVLYESRRQAYLREYAAGPEVSNDNDHGEPSFETRLNRLNSCLHGYDHIANKLPSYMQMHDIFPLSPTTNTHREMEGPQKRHGSGAWTDCERHWDGIFNTSDAARWYQTEVNEKFLHVMYK